MPHEVIKRVGARAYRYSVESYRDQASGKVRGRWTYLGRVEGGLAEGGRVEDSGEGGSVATSAEPRRRGKEASAATRERLLAALERLLERGDFARIGAADIAAEAGVAHGTFYRHFKNKRAALIAVFERTKAEVDRTRPSFDEPLGDAAAERQRIRRWVESAMGSPLGRPGFLRAWYATLDTDPELAEARRARRAESAAAFTVYLNALGRAGLARIEHPETLAGILPTLFEGVFRAAVLDAVRIDAETVACACDIFERAIFAAEP